eukprot:COSAG06_NODE_63544_length_262_cov_0.625767_2_plen_24_part_01
MEIRRRGNAAAVVSEVREGKMNVL